MKLASLTIIISAMTLAESTTMTRSISKPENIRKLLAASGRRLEEAEEGIIEVEDELMKYSFKLLKCEQDIAWNNDNGYTDYGVAIIRACPQATCSESKQGGCSSGFADLAVPLSTFVSAYLEDQQANYDGELDANEYAQCAAYEMNGAAYYVGPACSDDGLDIKLALYDDAYCSSLVTGVDMEANGYSLPYSDGGLVSDECMSCGEYNGDDGNYDLKEVCANLYESSVLKCEEWDIMHYYWDAITEVYRFGQDTTGCKRIAWMDKSTESVSEWASIFALAFLVLISIVGAVWYTTWWKNRKYNNHMSER